MADLPGGSDGQRSTEYSEPLSHSARHIHRVDPRLVHSTLLEAWVPYVDARHLVVADAEVAGDSRRRTIFEMSARDVANTYFIDERRVADVLSALPLSESTVVVYGSLQGFMAALSSGLSCPQMIVGHLPADEDKWRVHPSVYLGDEDFDWVERIRERGVEVVVRPLPSDQPMGLRRDDEGRPILTELPATTDLIHDPLSAEDPEDVIDLIRTGSVSVVNERGLHLRAAHLLAQCAGKFESSVEVTSDGRTVNAKSLLGLTTLGAALGAELELKVVGNDAEVAFTAILALFESGFEEGRA